MLLKAKYIRPESHFRKLPILRSCPDGNSRGRRVLGPGLFSEIFAGGGHGGEYRDDLVDLGHL
jgi:hypothetical protein